MFSGLEKLAEDPILGLSEAFRADPRDDKIDLGVGVFKSDDGTTPIMRAVRAGEKAFLEAQSTKAYTPPRGVPGFAEGLERILFGSDHTVVKSGRLSTVQAPGGCGALRLAGELIQRRGQGRVYVGEPTWANHIPLLSAAGLTVDLIPYYDRMASTLTFERFAESLQTLGAEDVLLLHGACHNPTGADLDAAQWSAIGDIALDRGFLVFVDTAYHGIGHGLDRDADGIRSLAERLPEMLISYSCSKNFGLYRERVGALMAIGETAQAAEAIQSHLVSIARGMYSMPPAHGASIVKEILSTPALEQDWRAELGQMCETLREKRKLLVARAEEYQLGDILQFIEGQNGMFSLLPVTPDQVRRLRSEFGIYMTLNGRINVCGLTAGNVDRFCQALRAVSA